MASNPLMLIDRSATPHIIVLDTDDAKHASQTAQAYANQTRRTIHVVEVVDLAIVEPSSDAPTEGGPIVVNVPRVDGSHG